MKVISLLTIFIYSITCIYGQKNEMKEIIENDSILRKIPNLHLQISSNSPATTFNPNNFNHYSVFNKDLVDIPVGMELPSTYFFHNLFLPKTEQLLFSPFVYSISNNFEGADIIGYKSKFLISDKILLNISAYLSSGYFGHFVPRRVSNASLNLGIGINITDRLFLYGEGIMSLNDGINPSFMPLIGASKGFGISISYKITENLFLHGGYQRNYYRGKWHNSFYILPEYIIWKKK